MSLYDANLQHVKLLRKTKRLHVRFKWIDFSNIVMDRKFRERFISHTFDGDQPPLVNLLHLQYRRHSLRYWDEFLTNWLGKCDKMLFAYTRDTLDGRPFICGMCMLIEGKYTLEDNVTVSGHANDIYIRLICSNSFCGSAILDQVKHKYEMIRKYQRLTLHSEPDDAVVKFYIKNGFIMLDEAIFDSNGVPYPVMVYSLRNGVIIRDKETVYQVTRVPKSDLLQAMVQFQSRASWYLSKWFGI